MTAHRLTWILSLAVALAGSGLGCGDDKPSADASTTGGTGGSAGRGGTGGTAGRGGAGGSGGTGGSAGTAGTTAGSGGSGSDASGDTAGTGGTGTGGTAGTGGAGGSGGTGGGTDAAADMALPVDLPVDQPLPVDLPPDTQATTVNVSDCAQFMCPQLTSVASQCQASETTCVHSKEGADQTNYCHSNGVKKVANTTFNGNAYTTIMEVFKANSGDDCYTLEIRGTGGTPDMQNWTYKSTAGATLATATWRSDTGQLTIRCDNVNYVIGNVGCPGTDGQPDDTSAECPAGTCSEP
jgi:hypothetical protein